jgi:hypothetical protein
MRLKYISIEFSKRLTQPDQPRNKTQKTMSLNWYSTKNGKTPAHGDYAIIGGEGVYHVICEAIPREIID